MKNTDTSIAKLLRISFPIMLAFLSTHAMLFANRIILADYSLDAMNAVATAGMIAATFQFGLAAITSISEVFVGQNNGLKKFDKMGEPVWQMIWFALAVQILFILVAYFLSDLLVPAALHEHGLVFFRMALCFGCLQAIFSALSGFYIGQGKTILITLAAIIANMVNIILSCILVFGYQNIIPELGVFGSAVATVIASFVEVFIIAGFFLSKANRQLYGTSRFSLKPELMKSCLRIGAPAAVGHIVEIAAWSTIAHILAAIGQDYLTIQNLCSTFFLLFSFFTEGLQKGMVSICSNLIGSNQIDKLKGVLKSGVCIHFVLMLFLALPLFVYPDRLSAVFNISSTSFLGQEFHSAMRILWLFCLFDGLVWIISGILVSAGDTKFIMWANAITAWIFGVLPIKLITMYFNVPPGSVWGIVAIYAIINCILFFARYRSQKWLKLKLS